MAEQMTKFVRIYKSERGIWRCEIERGGGRYWFSLHTRVKTEAERMAERQKAIYDQHSAGGAHG